MTIRLVELSPRDLGSWLDPALSVYVTAMEYPRGTESHRAPLWREHARRPGWQGIAAVRSEPGARTDTLVGIAYGYRGGPGQWWNDQLAAGLRRAGRTRPQIDDVVTDYFELTELHVHPVAQGQGVGQLLLMRLLRDREERRVLLSTPEVAGESNRAWHLYRRLGFTDVLRGFTFTGDPRPFAVLSRALPL
ncbi:GNAT family N-acetyltransferase [Williamsia sterculiae]|uniref:Ribosomal protein S18 acetylase RimI n=1 Tax=Williamsia sterculiae TaxID=1344003 RepID=A0A1N7H6Z0_9NOCA|nr:GNAT family N-acetyltransferase [Williamsia sterculiae]SIS20635.1 Ribosomal protein S18 acetylase RimI [Williamsia sterculiae]